jgi:hypothetical protein
MPVGLLPRVRSQTRDPGTADTHITDWQVLDSSNVVVASGAGTNFPFTPIEAGSYTVVFAVTDDDAGTAFVSQAIAVTAIAVQPDPLNPGSQPFEGDILSCGLIC